MWIRSNAYDERSSASQEIVKAGVGIHVLRRRLPFGDGILRKRLRRVSPAKQRNRLPLAYDSDGFAERSLNLRFIGTYNRCLQPLICFGYFRVQAVDHPL
jgi:hypothetical protein